MWFYSPYINHFLQPDTVTPGGPQGLNRYSYVTNNPINFNDPTGHRECDYECQIEYEGADPDYEHYCEDCEWDVAEQQENEEVAETILYGGTELVISVLFDPADWAITINDCANGDCSALSLIFMAIPVLSGQSGKALYRVIKKTDPQYLNFLKTGQIVPRGGPSTLIEHVNGVKKTNSNFTSWTMSLSYAERIYDDTKVILRVNPADIPNTIHDSFRWSDFIGEAERTIEGVIESGVELFR